MDQHDRTLDEQFKDLQQRLDQSQADFDGKQQEMQDLKSEHKQLKQEMLTLNNRVTQLELQQKEFEELSVLYKRLKQAVEGLNDKFYSIVKKTVVDVLTSMSSDILLKAQQAQMNVGQLAGILEYAYKNYKADDLLPPERIELIDPESWTLNLPKDDVTGAVVQNSRAIDEPWDQPEKYPLQHWPAHKFYERPKKGKNGRKRLNLRQLMDKELEDLTARYDRRLEEVRAELNERLRVQQVKVLELYDLVYTQVRPSFMPFLCQ